MKWSANEDSKSILVNIGENKLASSIRTVDLTKDEPLPDFKAVGCLWDAEKDILKIQFSLERPEIYTRCLMLSHISRQYDPLGYSAPLMLKARLILQQMTIDHLSWDEPATDRNIKGWNNWLETLITRKDLSIWWFYFAAEQLLSPQDNIYELHAFSDSSNEAYGCAVYLRRIANIGLGTSFVFGKSHIVL